MKLRELNRILNKHLKQEDSMAKFSTSQVLFIASAAFLGGMMVSLLSSPTSGEENRKWIHDNTEDFKNKVISTSRELKNKNLPNLYEATENLGLTDDDLIAHD